MARKDVNIDLKGKAPATAEGRPPHGTGSVSDSDQAPSGYYWDRLAESRGNASDLSDLLDELQQHGYRSDGQIVAAVNAALEESGTRRSRSRR